MPEGKYLKRLVLAIFLRLGRTFFGPILSRLSLIYDKNCRELSNSHECRVVQSITAIPDISIMQSGW
jgi:hypothetical protein